MKPRSEGAAAARPPTAARWPRLEELDLFHPDQAALEALGSETWGGLHSLRLGFCKIPVDAPAARAVTAALQRMPALRKLELSAALSDAAADELFRASSAEAAPRLRALRVASAITPEVARKLAATGWRLEELDLSCSRCLGRRCDRGARRRPGLLHPPPQLDVVPPRHGRRTRRGQRALAARGAEHLFQRLQHRRARARARGAPAARAPAPPGRERL
jgi:hypothetical protein